MFSWYDTYSAAEIGLGISRRGLGGGWGAHGKSMSSDTDVVSGVGEGMLTSVMKENGALWGRGEMSMESGPKPGDDEGIGGVVTPSHRIGGVVVPSASDKYQHLCTSQSQALLPR